MTTLTDLVDLLRWKELPPGTVITYTRKERFLWCEVTFDVRIPPKEGV